MFSRFFESVHNERGFRFLLLLILVPVPALSATERASVNTNGVQSNDESYFAAISDDGRYVAFTSYASNLAGPNAGWLGVYLYDSLTDSTERVSVNAAGNAATDDSDTPSVSADGRYIAFGSAGANLVPGDTNGRGDVFVRDRDSGTTTRVSVAGGVQGNADSGYPEITPDGRFVAFESLATNFVPVDGNRSSDIFLVDRDTGSLQRVSVSSGGGEANGRSFEPAISDDGRFVAFWSDADNLVPDDDNASYDVFVHDVDSRITQRVSVGPNGVQGNADSVGTSMSADARFVGFDSDASNLVAGDTNGVRDAFVHDRATGITERISVANDGAQSEAASYEPVLSRDGRFVAFLSAADNLVAGDDNGSWDIFIRDRQLGTTRLLTGAVRGGPSNGPSWSPAISADARAVAYVSVASNLVAGDSNNASDVFLWTETSASAPTGPTMTLIPDLGGSPALAILYDDPASGQRTVSVKSGSGASLAQFTVAAGAPVVALKVVPDFAGGPAPELALLLADGQAWLYDAVSGAEVGRVGFELAGRPVDLEVSADLDGNGKPDLAVLGDIDADIEVRDAATGELVAAPRYAAGLIGRDLLASADGAGVGPGDFAVLGENTDPRQADRIQVLTADGAVLTNGWLGGGFTVRELGRAGDINNDGVDDLATLRSDAKRVNVVLSDATTGRYLSGLGFDGVFRPMQLITVEDLNGNGSPEAGVLARNPDTGAQRVELKDTRTKRLVGRIWLPPQFPAQAASVLPDMNGNGKPEVAVLGQRADGRLVIFVKDAKTGKFVKRFGL
jgi:Tol biopolymer transport system component